MMNLKVAVVFAVFKDMVGNSERQYFVVTGSGMATAWSAFLNAPPHGHALASTIFSINIPELCHKPTLEWCAPQLNAEKLLPFVTNPAQLIFFYLQYSSAQVTLSSDDDLNRFIDEEIDRKYVQEFVQDLLPLLNQLVKEGNTTTFVSMRRLAVGIGTETPKGECSDYLKHFLTNIPIDQVHLDLWNSETNNAPLPPNLQHFIGLRSRLFSTLVKIFITPNGNINATAEREWINKKRLPISVSQFQFVDGLFAVSSTCEKINPV